jgi:predicted nucleotide-binding protein
MTERRLPELFIGSSSESLPVVELIAEALVNDAKVTTWTDRTVFRPTHFYVEELLRIPDIFDFGLFLFEPDDIVESRGVALAAPRDNVVFELGLFMSRLGLQRAFAMGPRGRVRILSDISGLKLVEYDEPPEVTQIRAVLTTAKDEIARSALKELFKVKLKPKLESAMKELKDLLEKGRLQRPGVSGDAQNVLRVGETMRRLVGDARAVLQKTNPANPVVAVRHLALDLSEAWAIICENVLSQHAENMAWRCLMLNPKSRRFQELGSYTVSPDVAAARIGQIQQAFTAESKRLASRNVCFECRAYDEPQMVHGFHIERIALLSSMCSIPKEASGVASSTPNWRLEASSTPYWRFEAQDDESPSSQPARAFQNWFDFMWEHSQERVWGT